METHLFNEAIQLLQKYLKEPQLTSKQQNALSEVISRLKSVHTQYSLVIKSNTTLLSEDPIHIALRETMSEENINKIMAEQARKNPNLAKYLASVGGKLVKENSTEISAFNMTKLSAQATKKSRKIESLHSNTEAIYNNLWLIKQRLNQLPKFVSFNPAGVRNVRNQLMTHTEKSDSEAYIFSFGVSTYGPVLRPIKPIGVKAPNDKGLKINVENFLTSITRILT